MFVRFRQTPSRLQVSLAEGRRVGGTVRHEHIASLVSILVPATIADRVAYWRRLHERLAKLSNRIGADEQGKILGPIHARFPMVTIDELRTLQRENSEANEKFWAGLQGMNTELAEGHKELAAKSARLATDAEAGATYAAAKAAVAEDQIERLAKGEDVKGGLGKPMTLKALWKAAGITESQARHAERVHSLGDGLFEKFVQAGIEGMHRGEKLAERKFLRRHRPE